MKTSTRNLYTTLSLLPGIFFLLYIVFFIAMFMSVFNHMGEMDENGAAFFPFRNFGLMFALIILMVLVSITALILFILHAINNKSLPENERLIWILVFIFVGVIGFPLYWFMRGIRYNPADQQTPGT